MSRLQLLSLIFCCLSSGLIAQTPIALKENIHYSDVYRHLEYLVDAEAKYTVADLQQEAVQAKFQAVVSQDIVPDRLDAYLWLRMVVCDERLDSRQSWYFESWGFDIDEISFYSPDHTGRYRKESIGYDLDFNQRSIYHKNFNFLLDIRPGEREVYYIRLKRSYPMQFTFHLRTNEAFIAHALTEYLFLGLYYGFLIIIFGFSVYLLFRLWDRLYFYFGLLILATIWYSLSRDGLGFQFLWPDSPALNSWTRQPIAEFFLIITTLAFCDTFISKSGDYRLLRWITLSAILFKFSMLLYNEFFTLLSPEFSLVTTLLVLGLPFGYGVWALIRNGQFSWLYTIAFVCLFLGFIQTYAGYINLIANPVVNWYIFNAGIVLEVVLFSLSIISQIARLREQNEKARSEKILILEENNRIKDELNDKLEEKVAERTLEIEQMAVQLAEVNAILSLDNQKLQTDIDAANRARVLMKGVDFEGFKQIFADKESCLQFLAGLKWPERYQCKKCGYNQYSKGRVPSGRRCRNCNYDESPTTDTLFHKLKFPLEKAFYMVYLINRKDADMTLNELSELIELRRETCWAFKQKVLLAIEKSGHNKDLSGWENLVLLNVQ